MSFEIEEDLQFLANFFLVRSFFNFFVARYLTISLRGPVLAHYDEADRPSWMGWVGMGWDKWVVKSVLQFYIRNQFENKSDQKKKFTKILKSPSIF